jgi:hypothetical protein
MTIVFVYSYLLGSVILERIFRSRGVITTDVAFLDAVSDQFGKVFCFIFFVFCFSVACILDV